MLCERLRGFCRRSHSFHSASGCCTSSFLVAVVLMMAICFRSCLRRGLLCLELAIRCGNWFVVARDAQLDQSINEEGDPESRIAFFIASTRRQRSLAAARAASAATRLAAFDAAAAVGITFVAPIIPWRRAVVVEGAESAAGAAH